MKSHGIHRAIEFINKIDWQMWLILAGLAISIREGCVYVMRMFNAESYGNFVGLFLFLILLKVYQLKKPLAPRFLAVHGKAMKESAFVLLPFIAGVVSVMISLQNEFWRLIAVMALSTMIPLWLFAFILERNKHHHED